MANPNQEIHGNPVPAARHIPLRVSRVAPPTPRAFVEISVRDDRYSDRIRCDHPPLVPPRVLASRLATQASACGRGRVVLLAQSKMEAGFREQGYETEALMPGFYEGEKDCVVMGLYLDQRRGHLANPKEVARVNAIVDDERPATKHPRAQTRLAQVEDADAIAELLGDTFSEYPTPSHDPKYLRRQIQDGTPFRMIEIDGRLVACASADLLPEAKTAELTDCATLPAFRGSGYMQFLLEDLMGDLRAMGYPTAFTLARARVVGINLAFQRLGFELRGCMPQSCRIGDGIEDMNVWSRRL